jgi:hypothetical protein
MNTTITLSRKQLYNRAWTTPIDTLARELGLSGRGLGKLCGRYNIPVPPRGYWAKKAVGKRVVQPPLPTPGTYDQKLLFNTSGEMAVAQVAETELHPLIVAESLAANHITVSESLPLSDPLVVATQKRLLRTRREPSGLIAFPARALAVHTSRTLHERALRIMQALLTAFADRGFCVSATAEGTRVTILDESLAFAIFENTRQVPHRVSFSEQKLIDRGAGWQVPKSDVIPAGSLVLAITNVKHVRQRWSESSTKPLESRLNKFVVGLVRAALGLKQQRADADRRERERQEQERQRHEEARRQAEAALHWREEEARMQRLERLAAMWRRNQELRQLVASIQSSAGDVAPDSELGKWLAWAASYVQTSDPLRYLRKRGGRTLTVYYHGWDHARIPESGFSEPTSSGYGNEKTKAGVDVTCSPPRETWFGRKALKLELPEDILLPFEWAYESSWYYRTFRVPATVLNRTLNYGHPDENESDEVVDEESVEDD